MKPLTYEKLSVDWGGAQVADPSTLLDKAVQALLVPSDELESPFATAVLAAEEDAARAPVEPRSTLSHGCGSQEAARDLLEKTLNAGDAQLMLIVDAEHGLQPERGDDLEANYVFSLVIPSLSDEIYWIVMDKTDLNRVSVYGFN